ncbi:1-acyl-sn-glycerol-3-phosphate acyltransferase [Synechococcus sp. GFB01]|uniref:lysophospholipid acyltransferase family protein n=1 Tax=Synechococcus sp. GFB01 TaxID=1662190 RepID=UPI00128BA6C3|nr:1-acyl-sn-glycerol-3-phosphate acyltransferase [Synechococcus sp. GFB01]
MRLQPPLAPIRPAYSPAMRLLVELLLPLLLRVRLLRWLPAGITALELEHGERLVGLLRQFRQGRCRLLLAFRHSEVDDPLCGLWLMSRALPADLRPQPVHFLYDRGMPLWGGRALGWVLSRLGGVSLRRGRHPDWSALRQARQLLRDGPFPFVLAPEGATNGHGEHLGPLEPGAARLALWCRDDLRRAGRSEAVWIVPIGIRYTYPGAPWPRLDRLLGWLESQLGLEPLAAADSYSDSDSEEASATERRYRRLRRIGEVMLAELECFYGRFGGCGSPPQPQPDAAAAASTDLAPRLDALRDRALRLAEARLHLRPVGTPEDRCRRLEEVAWQWIHREDLPPRHHLPPLQRHLADWTAAEAALALRHMRLVETFVAVSGHYVADRPSFERFAETACCSTTAWCACAAAACRGGRGWGSGAPASAWPSRSR